MKSGIKIKSLDETSLKSEKRKQPHFHNKN